MLRKTANLWHAYDRFGYRQAEWIPYFCAETGLAKSDNPNVKTSLYLQRQKRALLVVGNLAHEVVNSTLTVDLKAMGLRGTSAVNVLDDRPLPTTGGVLPVRLRPNSFLLIQIQ
jgi:hypothetical protein